MNKLFNFEVNCNLLHYILNLKGGGDGKMAYVKLYKISKDCHKKIESIMSEKKAGDSNLIYRFVNGECPCHLQSAYHIVQRFPVDEYITPELAHQIGKEFAQVILKDYHDYVVATHTHSKVLHNHIIVESSLMYEDEDFSHRYEEALLQLAVEKSNQCCSKYGLSTIKK